MVLYKKVQRKGAMVKLYMKWDEEQGTVWRGCIVTQWEKGCVMKYIL